MNRSLNNLVCLLVPLASFTLSPHASGQHAVQVVSYDAGTNPANEFGGGPMTVPSAALGEPSRFTPDANFPSVVSVFSPPYKASQLVSIGAGGHLTLRLSHYAIPQAGAPEIGVFANAGIALDFDAFPNLQAGTPAEAFGDDLAKVEVSDDGVNWFDLGDVNFNMPTNGYTDLTDPFSSVPGDELSDFRKPFTAAFDDFSGLAYPDILDLLDGSGGGRWLNISGTGLARVGYIRFSVPADAGWNFELDAVSIAHSALGALVVPEPATMIAPFLALAILMVNVRRRSRGGAAGLDQLQARSKVRYPQSSSGWQ